MAALDYVGKANRYIKQVTTGKKDVCRFVRQACERQLRDLENSAKKTNDFPYDFDRKKANRVCAFIERLDHVKGGAAGTAIHLEDWQCFILTTIYGWVCRTGKRAGKRRFRKAYTEATASPHFAAAPAYTCYARTEKRARTFTASRPPETRRALYLMTPWRWRAAIETCGTLTAWTASITA